jgi:hypothetical protein
MAVSFPQDQTIPFNSQYQVTMDMGLFQSTVITAVSPINGTLYVYGTNDGGAQAGITFGNAKLATNFNPVLVTNMQTGSTSTSITSGGNYSVTRTPRFLRIQGSPAATPTNIYKLLLFSQQ